MVTKEILQRHKRTISGESKPFIIKNSYETIIYIPVYEISNESDMGVEILTSNETNEDNSWHRIYLNNKVNNNGIAVSLMGFRQYIKIRYDLGKDGICDFGVYVLIKKLNNNKAGE